MDRLIETIEYRGYEIEIYQDDHADSPAALDQTECFLVYDHRQFDVRVAGFVPLTIWEECQRKGKMFYDGYYVLPVYAYIHSGVSLSLGDFSTTVDPGGWDTSMTGFVLIKKQKYTWTKKAAKKRAEGLIESWNQYLSGEIYGYSSEAGSCWGFYGDQKYMIEQAKTEIDYHVQEKLQKHSWRVKAWIQNKVPLIYRE